MAREKCKKEHCEKDAISFSDFCGEHSDAEAIVEALNSLEGKIILWEFYISDIELSQLELKNFTFKNAIFINVTIKESSFEDCNFESTTFDYDAFEGCKFTNCSFEKETNFNQCHFIGNNFRDVRVANSQINRLSIHFGTIEESHFMECTLTDVLFEYIKINGFYLGLGKLVNSKFEDCHLENTIIEEEYFKDSFFLDCKISKTYVEINSELTNLHTFFSLCLVSESFILDNDNLIKPLSLKDLSKWNGVDERPIDFYLRIINHIWSISIKQDVEVFSFPFQYLEISLKRILDIANDAEKKQIKHLVTTIFINLFNAAKINQRINESSRIMSELAEIDEQWLINIDQFQPKLLPLSQKSTLKLDFQTNELTLAKATNIFRKLDGLEILFVGEQNRSAKIKDLQVGSITITIGGGIITIVLFVHVLINFAYKGVNLYLDFQKKVMTNKKLKLEIAEKQKALNTSQQQESELEVLQKEKLEQEIKILKLQQFQLLSEMTGVKPEEILGASVMKQAKQLGQTLANEAEQLDLYVNIAEEDTKQQLPPSIPPPEY